ncbi:MAG: hypothetical protein H6Q99_3122 [Proteobacteria bacterium]|nr:hypothetical protein [Pseudomonadota bacterium]
MVCLGGSPDRAGVGPIHGEVKAGDERSRIGGADFGFLGRTGQ